MQTRALVRLLSATTMSIVGLAVPISVAAQGVAAPMSQQRNFNVPADALSRAALRLSDQADIQIVIQSNAADGLRSKAVRGRLTIDEALSQLLGGTGLSWRYVSPGMVSIERAAAADATAASAPITGDRVFGAVNIQGQQGTAASGFSDPRGFGSGAGSNGSSDPVASEGTGSLTTNGSVIASRLPQPLQETTQSVSTLTFERLKQQNLTNLIEALNSAPGITARTSTGSDATYLSRGYQIDTFSIDGGAPFSFPPNAQGSIELSQYDRVEILRGSAGQFGGSSFPGGTISLIRKRPLDHFQMNLEAGYGSYNDVRGEYDVTGPVGFDGHLRARFVLSGRDRDFFYDVAHQTRGSGYGVVEVDLGERTLFRGGGSYQLQRDDGLNLRGLPRYATGAELPLPRSTNFTTPFAEQDIDTTELFAAAEHRFAEGWDLKLDATRRRVEGSSLFVPFAPGQIFPSTVNPTISGRASRTNSVNQQTTLSGSLGGKFELFGRDQLFVVGAQNSDANLESNAALYNRPFYSGPVFAFDPSVFVALPGPVSPPSFVGDVGSTQRFTSKAKLFGVYAKLALNPLEPLRIEAGVRYNRASSTSANALTFPFGTFGGPQSFVEKDTSFNASVAYDFTDWLTAYASYNDIFTPQATLVGPGPTFTPLTPARGQTFEGGLRFKLRDGKLNGSISYYDTRLRDLSYQLLGPTGVAINPTNTPGCCFTQIAKDTTRGIDVELSGALTDRFQLQLSYNYNKNDKFGEPLPNQPGAFSTQQPRHTARLFGVYNLPGSLERLTIGAGGRFESKRSVSGTACLQVNAAGNGCAAGSASQFFSFSQPDYAIADAFIRYRMFDNVVVAFNVTNLTDKRYFAQTGSVTANNFYGEPRQFALSIRTSLGDKR